MDDGGEADLLLPDDRDGPSGGRGGYSCYSSAVAPPPPSPGTPGTPGTTPGGGIDASLDASLRLRRRGSLAAAAIAADSVRSTRRLASASEGSAVGSSDRSNGLAVANGGGGSSADAHPPRGPLRPPSSSPAAFLRSVPSHVLSQLPAVALIVVLNFLVGIPFGASYFPTELQLEGKEVLGLRMFLFSTAAAQLVFTFGSRFEDCVGLQMVENVPFCLELARIVIEEVGNSGSGASSTLFFLFGLSSVIVGATFYLLGRLELGRVVYFFPSHVLVGCIGGIGAFIVVTSLEVTTDTAFSFTAEGFEECILNNLHLLGPVFAFEAALRLLMRATERDDGGEAQFPMLGPVYYLFITPAFYAALRAVGTSAEAAEEAGYFFPRLGASDAGLFAIFAEVRPGDISWNAVVKSLPTMVSLVAFSLIHVPINIPTFAISTNVEPDMNAELIAHGYSNAISGIFGGLQNYLAYSPSVIYSRANGKGKWSSLAIAAATVFIYIYGPTIASYVPRCMAGTLLMHVGIDLFLEGVIEPRKSYDRLEYAGICLIAMVMVLFGMEAALIAGIAAALSTYVAQSVVYQDPIRGAMTGARLRSSAWNRCHEAQAILDGKNGRQKIYIIQLQGHIFFGSVARVNDYVKGNLNDKRKSGDSPAVVILDFTHVLGLDSSAAQSIAKLKSFILKNFDGQIIIFVTGHEDGFLCTYDLSHEIAGESATASIRIVEKRRPKEIQSPMMNPRLSLTAHRLRYADNRVGSKGDLMLRPELVAEIPNTRVCETLDDALIFAEDVLVALENPSIVHTDSNERFPYIRATSGNENEAMKILETLCPHTTGDDLDILYGMLSREKYRCGDTVWEQGDESTSLKFVIEGLLSASIENELGATETVSPGSTIGELGLVQGINRLTTVKVLSGEAVLYSLSKERWETLTAQHPRVARIIDLLLIRYLAHRVQHVSSSNILDRRSLPV